MATYSRQIIDPRNPGIVMATSIIIESIFEVMGKSSNEPSGSPSLSYCDRGSHLWVKLREDGWCPSELARLFTQFNTSYLYFIYNLPRPAPHETH